MSNNFFEQIKDAELKTVRRGGGGKANIHKSAYVNNQARLFNAVDKFDTYYDIKSGQTKDGTVFIAITEAKPLVDKNGNEIKDKDGNLDYGRALKSSVTSTGSTPAITITRLCKELFGDDKKTWMHDFEYQGEQDGVKYYTLIEPATEKSTK